MLRTLRTGFFGRTVLTVGAGVLLAVTAASGAVAEGTSALYLTTAADCRPAGYEELACGDFGTLLVGREPVPPKSGCGLLKVKPADRGLYPEPPADAVVKVSEGSWYPCREGSCFTTEPSGPWVAVIDWNNPHGWSVGETVRQASDGLVETRLYALDASGLAAVDHLPAASDVHVLAQLCRIAEDARARPPLAVNMSFGRLAEGGEAPEACAHNGGGVACTIGAVIAHLRDAYGTPTFAAAGHEGRLLYPAADPGVLAVGALDLGHLRRAGVARPLPQTPAGVAALFPGHGLYLEAPGGAGFWTAPPGSSYASAIAAGWWAGYRLRAPKVAGKHLALCSRAGPLAPSFGAGSPGLGCGALTLPDSGLARPWALLATALGERPEVCERAAGAEHRELAVDGLARFLPELTLADVQADLSHPAPDSRPCVPCHTNGDDGGDDGTGTGEGTTGSGGSLTSPGGKSASALAIDLADSHALPRELELAGVYLQVGAAVYRFSDSENATLLGDLALGQIDELILVNVPANIFEEPVALVFALRLEGDGRVFRSSTPVLVHDHR